jgi:hypothetical protein
VKLLRGTGLRPVRLALLVAASAVFIAIPRTACAQDHIPAKVEIAFDRYHSYDQIAQYMHDIAAAYPDIVELRTLGQSGQGREMWMAIVCNQKTGPHTAKPAMWIDGAVHANEIQASEAVLYTLWYLTKAYGVNKDLTEVLDNYSFYLLPMVNPDSRVAWFDRPATPNGPRANQRPVDNDHDGLFDEDGPDDLDGDGQITQMWKADANGRWMRDPLDPRVFKRLPADKQAPEGNGWTYLGEEGIDNDGDGQVNEDGPGGDDMNRNWPSDWQPNYVQFGAGEYPFSDPETRSIGMFVLNRTNIAAVQSYHNAGGMILHGPGAAYRESSYTGEDRNVYDEIARTGEQLLPYYKNMVIYRDLYTVHGGFVNWTAEGLGIFSFTNEMWNPGKYFQREVNNPSEEQDWLWRDRMMFGQLFTPYHEYDHPQFGKILIGGLNKWSARSTPTFMLEEECHRNFAFTVYHAGQMPLIHFGRVEAARVGEAAANVWAITADIRNDKVMPTRSAGQRQHRIGTSDILVCGVPDGAAVLTSGTLDSWLDTRMSPRRDEPARFQLEGGIPGRGAVIFRFLVTAREGDKITLRYEAEKAKTIERTIELHETPPRP